MSVRLRDGLGGRLRVRDRQGEWLVPMVGVMALVLLLLADLILGAIVLGLTPTDVFLGRDPVSGDRM